ncbi:hypothetical protein H7J11_02885 [Mycobacterium bourgelatii]|nr:MmpS family transport accessory protein [Mycobacterium bourgelatii]MCV6973426.1 hypothetical protein [Mycobacterium bourgelatii]
MNNIGTISTTTRTLHDDVQDYPDDESYYDNGADQGYGDDGYGDDEYADYRYAELAWPTDRRWRPVTALLGGVIAVGAIATAVIINSGDSATTKATVIPSRPPISTATRTTLPSTAPALTTPSNPPSANIPSLPPETVTTLTPSTTPPTAGLPGSPPTAAPTLPRTAPPPGAALSPRTVVYSVTGTKQLFDLVTVVYTDEKGFPQTEVNVALPWTKVVVLNPGVQVESVIATSLSGHLSCTITNAQGQLVVASSSDGMLATCTK